MQCESIRLKHFLAKSACAPPKIEHFGRNQIIEYPRSHYYGYAGIDADLSTTKEFPHHWLIPSKEYVSACLRV